MRNSTWPAGKSKLLGQSEAFLKSRHSYRGQYHYQAKRNDDRTQMCTYCTWNSAWSSQERACCIDRRRRSTVLDQISAYALQCLFIDETAFPNLWSSLLDRLQSLLSRGKPLKWRTIGKADSGVLSPDEALWHPWKVGNLRSWCNSINKSRPQPMRWPIRYQMGAHSHSYEPSIQQLRKAEPAPACHWYFFALLHD